MFCTLFISNLKSWGIFTLKNDTKNKIVVYANNKKFVIFPGELKQFKRIDYKKYEFKIAETKATTKRSYLIAPTIIIKKDARGRYLKASNIFTNKKLPRGYSYKEYATGLKEQRETTIMPVKREPKTAGSLKITIKNDTPNEIDVTKLKGYPTSSNNEKTVILPGKSKTFRTVKYGSYELKVAETKASTKRSYRIAPVIIASTTAKNATFKASKIFKTRKLPKGYSYKTYATGLKKPRKASRLRPSTHLDPVETR